jgi:hypothetical protein
LSSTQKIVPFFNDQKAVFRNPRNKNPTKTIEVNRIPEIRVCLIAGAQTDNEAYRQPKMEHAKSLIFKLVSVDFECGVILFTGFGK